MRKLLQKAAKIAIPVMLVVLSVVLLVTHMILPTSGNERFFSGAAEDYYNELLESGLSPASPRIMPYS